METNRLLNNKGRLDGAGLFLRLARSASVEEVVEGLAEIAAEWGICLCGARFTYDGMEREFELPNAVAPGRIKELAVRVEGGKTHLVLKFLEPPGSAAVCEFEYAAHLAAHRIEILAGG